MLEAVALMTSAQVDLYYTHYAALTYSITCREESYFTEQGGIGLFLSPTFQVCLSYLLYDSKFSHYYL